MRLPGALHELDDRVRDVFTREDPGRQAIVHDGFAAVIYLVAATLVRTLPLPGGKS